jgi:hypothetical protein
LVLAAAGVVGFAFILMELVWYRMLVPLLGGSTYTFGLIIAFALAGIGAGSLAYGLFARRRAATLSSFATTCALEALCLAVPYALGDNVALVAARLRSIEGQEFSAMSRLVGGPAIVVFPAAFVAACVPLLIALLGRAGSAWAPTSDTRMPEHGRRDRRSLSADSTSCRSSPQRGRGSSSWRFVRAQSSWLFFGPDGRHGRGFRRRRRGEYLRERRGRRPSGATLRSAQDA